jgi:hypothetical protein
VSECRHGLDDRWCASCKDPRPGAASRDDETPGPAFTARYPGSCPGCGEAIELGQTIRGVGGLYHHARCVS